MEMREEAAECVDDRRLTQRTKQVSYGVYTQGYYNMMRLIESDPRLCNGGILPLMPPPPAMYATKRDWEGLLRKWRRALHMFDHVFIEGQDESWTSLDGVVENQRREWVSAPYANAPKDSRVRISAEQLKAVRDDPSIPTRLPVEKSVVPFLRSLRHYDSLRTVLQDAPSLHLTRSSAENPQNAGIKVLIDPSGVTAARTHVRTQSPLSPATQPRRGTSPANLMEFGRSPSPCSFPTPLQKLELHASSSPSPSARPNVS